MTLAPSRLYPALIVITAVLLCIAVYLPGLSGPWIFDDYTNIIHNSYVRITSLDGSSLYHAAFSMESGPLKRPISVISFALNHYFANGFNTTPFKLTNLVIHIANTLLVFWLAALILLRARTLPNTVSDHVRQSQNAAYLLAACAALIWSVHPLQLTSVLYVVQRMTELAATFTLLGLICYLHGRKKMLAGQKTKGLWLAVTGIAGGGILGILSKENAALLPLFVVLLEFFLFREESPWRKWKSLPAWQKWAVRIATALGGLVVLAVVINYALPRYGIREFTMPERLATEARVLFFYISLLFLPGISRLGHQHDDFAISTSAFVPWTTLPAIFGVVALIAAGLLLRKRNPLLGLGILWFFTGHLMESTILPLELVHEHRNYFPSFGFALGIVSVLSRLSASSAHRRTAWIGFSVIVAAFAATTYLRASQWMDHNSFYRYEIAHHPESARIQIGYSVLLAAQGRLEEARTAVRQAATLNPREAGYVMELMLLDARMKRQPDPADHTEVLRRLKDEKIMATTVLTLDTVDGCLQTWCSATVPYMEQWITAILEKPDAPDPFYFQYRLGRIKSIQHKYGEALNLFQSAHEADRHFLHPLFEQINIFLKLGQIQNAEYVLAKLKQANAGSRYPRDHEISLVEADIDRMREQTKQR